MAGDGNSLSLPSQEIRSARFAARRYLDEGLRIRRRKGSRATIVKWSVRLRSAVSVCLNQPSKIKSVFLIHDSSGQRILETTFDTSWQRFNQTLGEHRIRFHDLKAKGVTDDDNNT